jgi:hypothetical protein
MHDQVQYPPQADPAAMQYPQQGYPAAMQYPQQAVQYPEVEPQYGVPYWPSADRQGLDPPFIGQDTEYKY